MTHSAAVVLPSTREDRFRCPTLSCVLDAASCLRRQSAMAEGGRNRKMDTPHAGPRYPTCAKCELGKQIAATLGSAPAQVMRRERLMGSRLLRLLEEERKQPTATEEPVSPKKPLTSTCTNCKKRPAARPRSDTHKGLELWCCECRRKATNVINAKARRERVKDACVQAGVTVKRAREVPAAPVTTPPPVVEPSTLDLDVGPVVDAIRRTVSGATLTEERVRDIARQEVLKVLTSAFGQLAAHLLEQVNRT